MRVLFIFHPNKKERKTKERKLAGTIYCRVRLDGVNANDFSTYVKVMPAEWESDKQRIKGKSLQVSDDNMKLSQIQSDLTRLFLQLQSAGENVSVQHLVNLYTGKQKRFYTFWELVDQFAVNLLVKYKNEGTRRSYGTRITNIRLFLEENNWKRLTADQFNLGKADEFVRWGNARGFDQQYIVRHIHILKSITQSAVRDEILPVDKLASFSLKRQERLNTDHITLEQLAIIEKFEWRPEIRRIADLFLFSCYTGLHYTDAQTLNPDEMREGIDGRLWLYKPRGKYNDSTFFVHESIQTVPLSSKALALIKKYGGIEKLPKIGNWTYNDWLKQIQKDAGITVKLTVRVARKTFTDIMLNELCVSEESVAAMLGHNSTKHVRHYGRASERRIAKEVKWDE